LIQGRRDRRNGQYTAASAPAISFCKRSTAETKTAQGQVLGSGRDLALVRVLVLAAGLLGDDVVDEMAGIGCGGGNSIAWMMVLISDSVIDRSLMPSNNNPTSDEDEEDDDDDDDDEEPTDGTPNSLNSCKHKG